MFEFKEFTNPESPDYDITSSLKGGNTEPTQNEPNINDLPDEIPEDVEGYDDFSFEQEQYDLPDEIPEDIEEEETHRHVR